MTSQPTPTTSLPTGPGHEHGARSARPWWKKLLAAQEFGLVLVIVLIMTGLTAYTSLRLDPVPRTDRLTLPATASVADGPGEGEFTVTDAGRTRTYRAADGYEFRPAGGGGEGGVLLRRYTVNRFLNRDNLISVATTASFIAVMAVGMTGIIIMGGIDLSVGSIYALAAVLGAMVLHELNAGAGDGGVPGLVALPVGLLVCGGVGALCGLVNGVATVGLKVHPFIITLGGMAIYRGIAFVTTQGQSIGQFPESYVKGGIRSEIGGITPVPMFIMILVGLVGAFVLARTVFGRQTFAIGGNETAARYAGIAVGRVKIILFVLCGMLAGLSAAMMLGYFGAGASNAGTGYELDVIAAAVVGGASLSGGRGSALGAVLGAFIIQLINNSIITLGIDENYRQIIIGLAIVIAVVVDQAKHRLAAKR